MAARSDVRYVAINSNRLMGHVSGAGVSAPENELQHRDIAPFLDLSRTQVAKSSDPKKTSTFFVGTTSALDALISPCGGRAG
jgi:hypothetical protein